MNKLYFIGGFVCGMAAGIAITWYKLNDQYEKLANEEFEARREAAAKDRKEEAGEPVEEAIEDAKMNARINEIM